MKKSFSSWKLERRPDPFQLLSAYTQPTQPTTKVEVGEPDYDKHNCLTILQGYDKKQADVNALTQCSREMVSI